MSINCPADPCDFTGTLDQVEGHIGGVSDGLHDGVVTADVMKSPHGEGFDGPPVRVLAGVVVVGILLWILYQASTTSDEPDEEASVETLSEPEVDTFA